MSQKVDEWYPNGITCLQVYSEHGETFFGPIDGVDIAWGRDAKSCKIALQEYYDDVYNA